MRKSLKVIMALFLSVVATISVLIGLWRHNDTVKIIGCILLIIANVTFVLRLLKSEKQVK